ncbi:unnamed protein product [Linum trigynum]|uniref:Uncharacterized protein n=1 Tax=Linum trigynum TaxID=586398 RepID=A0AAV2DGP8_9ROSI
MEFDYDFSHSHLEEKQSSGSTTIHQEPSPCGRRFLKHSLRRNIHHGRQKIFEMRSLNFNRRKERLSMMLGGDSKTVSKHSPIMDSHQRKLQSALTKALIETL